MHPAGERDLLPDVGLAKRIAIVSAVHAMSLWAKRRFAQADWWTRLSYVFGVPGDERNDPLINTSL